MKTILPLQQRYKLFLHRVDKSNRIDATDFVGNSVTLEQDVNHISTLTFSMKNPEIHENWITTGTYVEFYGGYIDREDFKDSLGSSPKFRKMFSGNVYRLKANHKEDGSIEANVTCIDYSWSKSGYVSKNYRYPAKRSNRSWATKTEIRLSDIVRNIISEMEDCIEADIHLGENTDTKYTIADPIVQDYMSDWAFLVKLAELNSCYVWTSVQDSTTTIHFVDKSKAIGQGGRAEFVWPARDKNDFQVKVYNPGLESGSPERYKLKPNQIELLSANVEINPQIQGLNVTKITDFNEKGEQEDKFVQYDEGKDEIIYWKLNRQLVEDMQKTPAGKEELDRIFKMGAMDIPPQVFLKFYTPDIIKKGIISAIDKPFIGMTVSATANGDVNVVALQSYTILGISRFTKGGLSNKPIRFLLRSMVHKWDEQGYTMDLEFIA